jgi:hypothetical protein
LYLSFIQRQPAAGFPVSIPPKNIIMKKILLIGGLLVFAQIAIAQKLGRISIMNDGHVDRFTVELGEDVIVHISKDGQIAKWGIDPYVGRDDNFTDRIDAYTGKTGVYGETDDVAIRGKLKFIGRNYITYYTSYENAFFQGKIKSIGNLQFNYYMDYENEAFRGLLKSIGQTNINWFGAMDNEHFKGKLKTVGYTPITYYGSTDDQIVRGRLRSIGTTQYTYYTSFDQKDFRGSIKSGPRTVIASGIRFSIRY